MPDPKTGELRGTRNIKRLKRISQKKQDEEIARCLELGLEAAESINDRSISLFRTPPAAEGLDPSILESLAADGVQDSFSSNSWIGRLGP